MWTEIEVEIEWQPNLSFICSCIWLVCPVWSVNVAQRRPQAQWTISLPVSVVDETSAPPVSSQWGFFLLLSIDYVMCSTAICFLLVHSYIHTDVGAGLPSWRNTQSSDITLNWQHVIHFSDPSVTFSQLVWRSGVWRAESKLTIDAHRDWQDVLYVH